MATTHDERPLAERLARDQDFRRRLVADPAATLTEEGIGLEDIPADVVLPPREQFERILGMSGEDDGPPPPPPDDDDDSPPPGTVDSFGGTCPPDPPESAH